MKEQTLTQEGKEKLERELASLKANRKDIIDRIAKARELGDLSENAEYHSAREDQSFNEGRIKEIEAILANAQVIESKPTGNTIQVGSAVTLKRGGYEMTYHIVGSHEASLKEHKISVDSPLAQAMMGKKEEENFECETPSGKQTYTIVRVEQTI